MGLVIGNLSTPTLSLSDSSISTFNEFYQGFDPGSTLGFDLRLTTNVNGATPDAFFFAIFDKDFNNLPTTGLNSSLLVININSSNPTAQTFSSNGVTVTATSFTLSPVPEPSTAIAGFALLGVCGLARRRRRA